MSVISEMTLLFVSKSEAENPELFLSLFCPSPLRHPERKLLESKDLREAMLRLPPRSVPSDPVLTTSIQVRDKGFLSHDLFLHTLPEAGILRFALE